MMSSSCNGWYTLGAVDVHGDVDIVEHHLEVDGRPPAPIAVGHGQPGHRGGQVVADRRPPGRGLGGDLGDAVRAQERPDPVVVAELVLLGKDMVAQGLVHAGGRAVDEPGRVLVVLHQPGQAAAVGLEVAVPVVGLGDGEIDHVVGIGGKPTHVAGGQIDGNAAHPRRLQPLTGGIVPEPGGPHHTVLLGQGDGHRLGHLTGDAGDDDGRVPKGFRWHGRAPWPDAVREAGGGAGRSYCPPREVGRPRGPKTAGWPGAWAGGPRRPQEVRPGCGHRGFGWAILSIPPVFAGRLRFTRSPSFCRAVRPVIPTVIRK